MRKIFYRWLALTLLAAISVSAAQFANSVVDYNPGIGFATDFGTGNGLTNSLAALGEPSRVTPGQFGGPVDPFNPAYLPEQLVSIGTGGSLTLRFDTPIRNNGRPEVGMDFIVYGNAGFAITNGNFSGGGITDGSLFGANTGTTRVSVSSDNRTYYVLDPSRAPTVDTLFPTDGSGSFDRAVNAGYGKEFFSGLDLKGIRALYDGSAGGASYDLVWAQDASGNNVSLPEASYLRIEVLEGVAEVDGVSVPAAVPEPSAGLLLTLGLSALTGTSVCRWRTQSEDAQAVL